MLASWTLQTFDVAAQQRFADSVINFLPSANLMISIGHVTSGSIVFDTAVDVVDGNQTAANSLANALQARISSPAAQRGCTRLECHVDHTLINII